MFTFAPRLAKYHRAASTPSSASRSSSAMNVPARFDIESSLPPSRKWTQPVRIISTADLS